MYEDKKFGFTNVSWIIGNYCVIPYNSEKLFFSPEFYVRGCHLTKWRMILTRSYLQKKFYNVKFHLERLQCEPYIQDVMVDCCLEYEDHHGEHHEIEFDGPFGVHETEDLRLFDIATQTTCAHSDYFEIRLYILVHFPGIRETIPACSNEGIRRLSEDLINLYDDLRIARDLQLNFYDNQTIGVHKAMLLHRLTNEFFRRELIKPETSMLRFYDFMAEHADKVIAFLYTGNLHYAVAEPAVPVFNFAIRLDVKPIVAYYAPDEIELNSDTEVEEYNTTWTIKDFCNRDEYYLRSPVMINNMMDTKWRLQVYPAGRRIDGEYVHISIEFETEKSKDICAELFLGRPDTHLTITYHRKILPDGVLIGDDMVRRDNVMNYMSDDSLTIRLRLRMSTDRENFSVCESRSSYKHLSEQRNYERLSDDMLSIYENERFHNLQLEFNDHNVNIYAHRYILDVRCFNLSRILIYNRHYLQNVNHSVLFGLFYFLYSGRITRNLSLQDTFSLYTTAHFFNFSNLREVILSQLRASLSETNARDIFDFASREQIRNLEYPALAILLRN